MKRVLVAAAIMILFGACNPKQSWKRNTIESAEKKLMEQAQAGKADSAGVTALLADYELYSETYPSDTIGATYLFKAADFYRYMRKPLRSIEVYKKIYERYPTITKRPYALFLQGFIFENEVGNIHAAQMIYESFLKQYPSDPISKDVQTSLTNLGKTPDQLVAEFALNASLDSIKAKEEAALVGQKK